MMENTVHAVKPPDHRISSSAVHCPPTRRLQTSPTAPPRPPAIRRSQQQNPRPDPLLDARHRWPCLDVRLPNAVPLPPRPHSSSRRCPRRRSGCQHHVHHLAALTDLPAVGDTVPSLLGPDREVASNSGEGNAVEQLAGRCGHREEDGDGQPDLQPLGSDLPAIGSRGPGRRDAL